MQFGLPGNGPQVRRHDRTASQRISREIETRHATVAAELLDVPERRLFETHLEERLKTLDRLYESLSVLGELTPRGRDAVMGFGEQLSAVLLSAVLRARGLRAEAVDATTLIVTDDRFGAARDVDHGIGANGVFRIVNPAGCGQVNLTLHHLLGEFQHPLGEFGTVGYDDNAYHDVCQTISNLFDKRSAPNLI